MNRIRSRLVVAFLVVALLPAVPLSVLVKSLLERSFQPPFGDQAESALQSSLESSRIRLREEKGTLARWVAEVGAPAAARGERSEPPGGFTLDLGAAAGGGAESPLAEWARRELASNAGPGGALPIGPGRVGEVLAMVVPTGDGVIFARPLPEGLTRQAQQTGEAIALMKAFREDRPAVLQSYVLPFLFSYAALLLVAVAVGTVLAGRIARPVEALASGAERVGGGDLETRVDVHASGEVGDLVTAFNRMVADLSSQQGELARLERVAAWRDLARSLAHEIKNPLTPIQLAVQQLRDRYAGDDDYGKLLRECVEIVDEEVAALRRLVREFSEFARLPEPNPEAGDLAGLLDELSRLYGERLEWDGPRPLPASFDESELRRALINLVDNAIAACEEAGRPELARIAATVRAGDVELRVVDRGAGIPPASLERIFEPNFSTKSEGMGLGLAIVEGIVRGHGGTISVASREGEGTTFTIRLPAVGPESEIALEAASSASGPDRQGERAPEKGTAGPAGEVSR